MATRADIFYLSATDQDQAWGTDIRKLAETVQALNSTTICQHPNAAGTTQITLDPLTSRNTQGDNRDVFGWAINEAGADGMESTANRKRRIRSGNWVFTMRVSVPVGGILTGSLTASFSARVYRVGPAPNFTRTVLFTTELSTTVASTDLADGNGTCTVTQTNVPEIVLEAGETIHVGFISNLVQAAGALNATVAGNATWHVGTEGGVDPSINPPAIDTITEFNGSSSGTSDANGVGGRVLPVSGSSAGMAKVAGFTGTVNIGQGGSETVTVFKPVEPKESEAELIRLVIEKWDAIEAARQADIPEPVFVDQQDPDTGDVPTQEVQEQPVSVFPTIEPPTIKLPVSQTVAIPRALPAVIQKPEANTQKRSNQNARALALILAEI